MKGTSIRGRHHVFIFHEARQCWNFIKNTGDRDAIPKADGTSRNLPKRDVLYFRPASPANQLTMKVFRLRKVC